MTTEEWQPRRSEEPIRTTEGAQSVPSSLTNEAFWDDFWRSVELPADIDPDGIFERRFAKVLQSHLTADPSVELLEVGCAPGRWLVFANQTFGYRVSGYESSPLGAQKTRDNLVAHGINGVIHEQDFLSVDLPTDLYDVVLSLGFAEHFENFDEVVAMHARVLKPGGTLFLEVPNLRGLNLALLRWTDSPLLEYHNLAVMKPEALRSAAAKAGLSIRDISYLGGFEPWFFDFSSKPINVRRIFWRLLRARQRARFLDHLNHRWLSGYLLAILEKPLP